MFKLFGLGKKSYNDKHQLVTGCTLQKPSVLVNQLQTRLTELRVTPGSDIKQIDRSVKHDNQLHGETIYLLTGDGWLFPDGNVKHYPPIALDPTSGKCYWSVGVFNTIEYDNPITDPETLSVIKETFALYRVFAKHPSSAMSGYLDALPPGFNYYWDYGTFITTIPKPKFELPKEFTVEHHKLRNKRMESMEFNVAIGIYANDPKTYVLVTSSVGGDKCIVENWSFNGDLPINTFINMGHHNLKERKNRTINISFG